jgi:hypothetical protein
MKLGIGTILRTFTEANGQDEDPTQICDAQLTEDNDVQTIETQKIPGIQYGPTDGKHGFFGMFRAARKIFVSLWDGVAAQTLNQGELLAYASDNGTIKTKILLKVDGSIEITTLSAVNVIGDVIADFGATNISLLNHYHQGNLGYPTGTAIVTGGGTTPSTPPTTNASGDIIDGSSTNLSAHTHTQPNDSGGDTEGPTSGPL